MVIIIVAARRRFLPMAILVLPLVREVHLRLPSVMAKKTKMRMSLQPRLQAVVDDAVRRAWSNSSLQQHLTIHSSLC